MTRVRAGDLLGNISGGTTVVDRDLSGQPSGPVVLAGGDVSASLVSGSFVWELVFSPATSMISQQIGKPVICLCEATTSAGSLTIQYEAGRWFIRLAGVAILELIDPEDGAGGTYRNNMSQTGLTGDYMRVLFGYWPAQNLVFIQIQNNGAATFLGSNRSGVNGYTPAAVPTVTALTSVSAITVGSRIDTTLSLGAQWKRFRAFTPTSLSGTTPEAVLIVGDSVESALSYSPTGSAAAATSSHIFTPTEAAAFTVPKIRIQAIGGYTTGAQQATFTADVGLYGNIQYVVIGTGINDANAGATGSQMITAYQTLVTTIKAALPKAKIIARLLTPCKSFLGATNWSAVVTLNAALQDGHTFTGIDAVASSHFAAMSDGVGNVSTIYDSGDGVHPKDVGRACMASAVRGALSSLGYTTYDASKAPGARVIVFTGDSITAAFGLTAGVNDFTSVAISQLNTPWLWVGGGIGSGNFSTYNVGVGGSTAADKITADRTAVDPKLTSAYKNIVIFFAGTNDSYFGASAAQVQTNISSAVALYPAGSVVGVCTYLSRSNPSTPGTFNADRATVNAWIRTTYGANCIDLAADAIMGPNGAELNATYFQDLVHPTAAGDARLAAIVSAWINSVAP